MTSDDLPHQVHEGAVRLSLSLQVAAAEDRDLAKYSKLHLSWKCFQMGLYLYLRRRLGRRFGVASAAPPSEALQEAIDVVTCSPLIEDQILTSFLTPRKRYWHRVAATYEQLAVALEELGATDTRASLYCALRGALLASDTPFLTPTLARCFATLSLIHTSHSTSGEDECWRLDAHYSRFYNRLAHEAFGTTALVERSKSDLAWGLMSEGLVVAAAGKWERALETLTKAAELLLTLHAVRLWDECMLHIAFIHMARGDLDVAADHLERVHESSLERGDLQVRRWCEIGLAQLALDRGDLELADELLPDSNAWGLTALTKLRLGRPDLALASAYRSQGTRIRHKALEARQMFAATWVLLLLLQACLLRVTPRERDKVLQRRGQARRSGQTSKQPALRLPRRPSRVQAVDAQRLTDSHTGSGRYDEARRSSLSGGGGDAHSVPTASCHNGTPSQRRSTTRSSSDGHGGTGLRNSTDERFGERFSFLRRSSRPGPSLRGSSVFGSPSSTVAHGEFGDDDSRVDAELDWPALVDDARLLHAWAEKAVRRLEKFALINVTSRPAAGLCRAVLTGMHSDDTGSGAGYSPQATQMLHKVVSEARALEMPRERALGLQAIAIYSPLPSERRKALSQALLEFSKMEAEYHMNVCTEMRNAAELQKATLFQAKVRTALLSLHGGARDGAPDGAADGVGHGFFHRMLARVLFARSGGRSAASTRPPAMDLCSLELHRPQPPVAAAAAGSSLAMHISLSSASVSSSSYVDSSNSPNSPRRPRRPRPLDSCRHKSPLSSAPLWQSHPTDAQDDAYEGSELQRSSHLPRRHSSTGFGSTRSSRADPTSGSTAQPTAQPPEADAAVRPQSPGEAVVEEVIAARVLAVTGEGMSPLPPILVLARGNSESGAQIVPQGSPATTLASPRGDSSTARLQRWNTAAATAAGAGEAALADDPGAGDVEMGEMRSNIR
jgi:tetratricopeptide (TPR) repeat protein